MSGFSSRVVKVYNQRSIFRRCGFPWLTDPVVVVAIAFSHRKYYQVYACPLTGVSRLTQSIHVMVYYTYVIAYRGLSRINYSTGKRGSR